MRRMCTSTARYFGIRVLGILRQAQPRLNRIGLISTNNHSLSAEICRFFPPGWLLFTWKKRGQRHEQLFETKYYILSVHHSAFKMDSGMSNFQTALRK